MPIDLKGCKCSHWKYDISLGVTVQSDEMEVENCEARVSKIYRLDFISPF